MDESAAEVVGAIRAAFPDANPPRAAELTPDDLGGYYPFEAEELRTSLAGKNWTELTREFIDTHSDWLRYLTPEAFRYYLPAWLLYSVDWMRTDYAAQWISNLLSGPPANEPIPDHYAGFFAIMNSDQRSVVLRWLIYLLSAYPDEDIGWLNQKGMSLEDVVYNWTARTTNGQHR